MVYDFYSMQPILSILISIAPKRERHLALSLSSLTKTAFPKNQVELLAFIDFRDAKKTRTVLRRYRRFFASVRCFLVQDKQQSVSHSASRRNFLAFRARGPYLLFTEPEMYHVSPTLPLLLSIAHKKPKKLWYCGPVFATGAMVNSAGDLVVDDYRKKEHIPFLLRLIEKRGNTLMHPKVQKHYFRIDEKKYPTLFFCTMMDKEFFVSLKGLNQGLVVRGWEEIEYYERFHRRGGSISFDTRFVTAHLPHARTLSLAKQIGWNLFNSTVAWNPKQKMGEMKETVEEVYL